MSGSSQSDGGTGEGRRASRDNGPEEVHGRERQNGGHAGPELGHGGADGEFHTVRQAQLTGLWEKPGWYRPLRKSNVRLALSSLHQTGCSGTEALLSGVIDTGCAGLARAL